MTVLNRFIALNVDIISVENITLSWKASWRYVAINQVLCNVWSYDFYNMTVSIEYLWRHMIN